MGLPGISARALTVSLTPTLRPPCLRGFLCRSCAPDTGTHEGWRCCDYFEKSWDPGRKAIPELPGCVRRGGAVSRGSHPVRHSVAEEPSPATPIATCTRAGPPPNRRSRPNCDVGSGVVALGELQQLLRTGEITASVKSGIGNSAAEAIGSGVVALGELQQLLLRIRKPA